MKASLRRMPVRTVRPHGWPDRTGKLLRPYKVFAFFHVFWVDFEKQMANLPAE